MFFIYISLSSHSFTEFVRAFSRRDCVELATTVNRPRPPLCSSRRDEAIDTNHAAIGVRTKPLEPPEVLPLRVKRTRHRLRPPFAGAAVPGHRPSAIEKLLPHRRLSVVAASDRRPPPLLPVTVAGDSPVTVAGDSPIWSLFEQLEFIDTTFLYCYETDFCMPDCMRGYGQSVDRLDRSLVWSIKRLRAVTLSTLSEVFVWPVSGQRVRASLGPLFVVWHPIPHWAIPLSLTPHPPPFQTYVVIGICGLDLMMPPKRRATRAQTARDAREGGAEHEQPTVPQPAAPPIDQEAMRQIVQDAARQAAQEVVQQIAREAAREAAQEAARVAAQEVACQMAAVQQGPQVQVQQGPQIRVQQVPSVQDQQIPVQHDHQVPVQQVPLPQVPLQEGPAQQFSHGVQDLPPPPQRPQVYPDYDERFYRLTCQMRNMDMEHFSGTMDAVATHDWKLALQRKLEIIECPLELSLRLTMQYLRGDALI
ncbi:hypothetical protein DY000_02020734 [Brassica cretica]|uniref:Uncharacterized protein n=1 Tax=Brassica cretica TaxID=69181 RepID=A0ABQ7EE34_BRACR|nr:hypothetical protein DY000_02020734 [Brassica cretica]